MIDPLHYRVLELSKRYKLGHLSSNLTAVGIIDEIYRTKRAQDIFVLSQGQAGLALYVNLEKHEGRNAEALHLKHGTHPNRDVANGIHVSAGSLGCAITVALGMAMADRERNVHVLISDGEAWQGSVYEVLNAKAKFNIVNLRVWINANGYSCIEATDWPRQHEVLRKLDRLLLTCETGYVYHQYPFLRGVQAHYHQLTDADWAWVEENYGDQLKQSGQCPDCYGEGQVSVALHSPPLYTTCKRCHGRGSV